MLEVILVFGAPVASAILYFAVAEITWFKIEKELNRDHIHTCDCPSLVDLPAPAGTQ